MDIHQNARLTLRSREALVFYVLRDGFTRKAAAAAFRVSARTVAKWVGRFQQEGQDGLRDRSSRPRHSPRRVADSVQQRVVELRRERKAMEKRIRDLRSAAVQLIRTDEVLRQQFQLLIAMPGIADISAVHLLGELAALPSGLSVREWVAYSGLDPAHQVSGTSVHKPSRISRSGSRHLRRALYMPALVASRRDPHLRAFYQTLLSRHKAKLQALIAVARKILHAIYGIFKHQTPYNGALLFPNLTPTD